MPSLMVSTVHENNLFLLCFFQVPSDLEKKSHVDIFLYYFCTMKRGYFAKLTYRYRIPILLGYSRIHIRDVSELFKQ